MVKEGGGRNGIVNRVVNKQEVDKSRLKADFNLSWIATWSSSRPYSLVRVQSSSYYPSFRNTPTMGRRKIAIQPIVVSPPFSLNHLPLQLTSELYLERTQSFCHLFKGTVAARPLPRLFFWLFLCSWAWHPIFIIIAIEPCLSSPCLQ